MENLNDKVWYRFLKVVFIIAFILIQFGSVSSVAVPLSEENVVSQQTFQKVGALVKTIYPTYTDLSDVEIGKRIYNKSSDLWYAFVSLGSTTGKGALNGKEFTKIILEYQNKYTLLQIILYSLVPFFIVAIIFWLISRIFFYVFAKDKFLSGRVIDGIVKLVKENTNILGT